MEISLAARAQLKQKAAEWADHYHKSFASAGGTLAASSIRLIVANANAMAREDKDAIKFPEGGLNTPEAQANYSFGQRVTMGRLYMYGMMPTFAALDMLLMVTDNPGGITMMAALIQHVRNTKPFEEEGVLKGLWLAENIFKDGGPTEHIHSNHWDRQKLVTVNLDKELMGPLYGRNLVDITDAFKLLTDEELEYLTAPPK